MSTYRRSFVSTVLYLYLFAELDALRTCPDRCICVGTTVRCMFLKLQTLPRVPEDTTVLDLRYNNIREVPARSFEDLEQLETLLLNNNQIRHIEGHGFEGLRNLRHLYIFKNRIKYLDENSFAGLQSLEQLYLHDNLLQEIGEPPFLGLLSLERLFLNDNRIRTVHKGALQNLRQLRRLRLDNNPLTCDCSLMWFTQMLQEKQTITQATGHCSLPASLAGKPLTSLVESDFACERPSLTEEPYDVEAAFGVKINFSCKAEGEPRPSITWQHDGDEVSTDQDNRVEILDDGTLVIHSSRIEDIGTYKCRAENAAGHVVSRTAYLRFTSPTLSAVDDRQAQKPRIVTKPSDVSVTAGRSVTMRCQAAGRPTPQVTWTRDGLPLFQNPRYHVSRTAGTLIITATDLSDSGKYMCTASSLLGEESAAAVLRVELAPYFIESPREQDVLEGDNVEFICHAGGFPAPQLSWYKDGQRLKADGVHVKNLHGGKVIKLYNVRRQEQGVYTCHAQNSLGYAESHADLLVSSKAMPHLMTAPSNTEADQGSTVEVFCVAEGHPTPTVSWRREGKAIGDTPRRKITRDGSLVVIGLRPEDEGQYECVVENEMGQLVTPFYILVRDTIAEGQPHPGDRYFLSALQEAEESVDKAINSTLQNLLNSSSSGHNHHQLLRIFRYPDSEAQRTARAAEIFERALGLIQEQVSSGAKFNLSQFAFRNLLSPSYLDLLAEKSGCLQHRRIPDCTDDCFHSRYRTYDGTCNNKEHPMWGASLTPFQRLLPAQYENGFNTPIGWTANLPVNGHVLPLARTVSTGLISTQVVEEDSEHSHMLMQWGQFLDHDMDFSVPAISHERFIDTVDCSESCENAMPCFPIEVPADDRRVRGHRCIEFVRSSTACGSGRTSMFYGGLMPREQTNQLTSFIDASNVYGSRPKQAVHLRNLTSDLGLLRVGPRMPSGKFLLPFNDGQPNDCKRNSEITDVDCFLAGDVRANEQLGLLSMHTLWFREHNRLAELLHDVNPHWDGERLYQETRKIVGAQMQHITYSHWLPKILGPVGMAAMGPYRGYDSETNPSIVNVFATAALRFGHFLINPVLLRLDERFQPVPEGPVPLRRAFFAPHLLLREGGIDPLMRGLFVASAKLRKADQLLNSELTDHLFEPALIVAQDLASFNIQRGRDHGLPGYNRWRQFCNLTRARNFHDLRHEITSDDLREKLERLYKTPDNIDTWVGAICEEPVPGSKVGPTLLCLLSGQFARVRDGDRLWYENKGSFTKDQLNELRRVSLARVLCDNGDNITRVTEDVFMVPRRQNPAFVNCDAVPSIDLTPWKDDQKEDGGGCPAGKTASFRNGRVPPRLNSPLPVTT
ncbi:peroxidasin homolog [Ixodes scapularis]|uniref:peroxidasin homolog n=1 Tax=Ixodes scapularis TaxID=6945 RepID=UPI001C386974|nr:peroxidasin homolog [Ixodes scapularis]